MIEELGKLLSSKDWNAYVLNLLNLNFGFNDVKNLSFS